MHTEIWKFLIAFENTTEDDREKIKKEYCESGRDSFYQAAKKKKVLPFVAKALVQLDLDAEFWNSILGEYRKRNTNILGALDMAYNSMRRYGVKKAFVSENFGALLSSSGDIGLFASGDVDNYVDPSEKDKLYRAFEEIGYTRRERYSGNHQIAAEFFPPQGTMGLPEGFYISVDFYPLARLKLPCFVEADRFVDWSALTTYKDTVVLIPPPTALMYICLLHISLHSFSRAPDIRLYIDLLNMSRMNIEYKQIERWCREDQTCTRVATAADICNKLLRSDFPRSLLDLSTRRARVKKYVFDADTCDLKYEPHGLTVLKIEIACDDSSDLHGIRTILFPDKTWMRETYGGTGFMAHIKHILKVI